MNNSNCCGSNIVIYSTIIALLLSSTIPAEKKEFIGNILLTIGQALVTADSACGVCQEKERNQGDNCSPYMNPYNGYSY